MENITYKELSFENVNTDTNANSMIEEKQSDVPTGEVKTTGELTNISLIDGYSITSNYDVPMEDFEDTLSAIAEHPDEVNFNINGLNAEEAGGIVAGVFAFILGMLAIFVIVGLACYVYYGIVLTKLLQKAKHPNTWAGWVPVYKSWALAEISGYPGYMGLLAALLPCVPALGSLAALIITCLIYDKLAKAFGKDTGFTVGLVLLNPIFMGILAFGSAEFVGEYRDPNAKEEVKEAKVVKEEKKEEKEEPEEEVVEDSEEVEETKEESEDEDTF